MYGFNCEEEVRRRWSTARLILHETDEPLCRTMSCSLSAALWPHPTCAAWSSSPRDASAHRRARRPPRSRRLVRSLPNVLVYTAVRVYRGERNVDDTHTLRFTLKCVCVLLNECVVSGSENRRRNIIVLSDVSTLPPRTFSPFSFVCVCVCVCVTHPTIPAFPHQRRSLNREAIQVTRCSCSSQSETLTSSQLWDHHYSDAHTHKLTHPFSASAFRRFFTV